MSAGCAGEQEPAICDGVSDDVQERWRALRDMVHERYRAAKDSQGAVLALARAYRGAPATERAAIDAVLAEWLLSDDEGLRFDARFLVDEFRIVSALPALRQLQGRLETASGPGAPYEWAAVNRVIGSITSSG